jgi:G:T-mismatch repair DNA endonuclease (very short patch repair protein)
VANTGDGLNLLPIYATLPETNAQFWGERTDRNQTRDRFVTRTLRRAGWRVLRIWDGARQRGDGRVATLAQGAACNGCSRSAPSQAQVEGRE